MNRRLGNYQNPSPPHARKLTLREWTPERPTSSSGPNRSSWHSPTRPLSEGVSSTSASTLASQRWHSRPDGGRHNGRSSRGPAGDSDQKGGGYARHGYQSEYNNTRESGNYSRDDSQYTIQIQAGAPDRGRIVSIKPEMLQVKDEWPGEELLEPLNRDGVQSRSRMSSSMHNDRDFRSGYRSVQSVGWQAGGGPNPENSGLPRYPGVDESIIDSAENSPLVEHHGNFNHNNRLRDRRRSRSRSRSREWSRKRTRSRSRDHSRSRHRSRSNSRERHRGRRRRSRSRSRSRDRAEEMNRIRREMEAMYDSAMQAMLRKKEEEYAALQQAIVNAAAGGSLAAGSLVAHLDPLAAATTAPHHDLLSGLPVGISASNLGVAGSHPGPSHLPPPPTAILPPNHLPPTHLPPTNMPPPPPVGGLSGLLAGATNHMPALPAQGVGSSWRNVPPPPIPGRAAANNPSLGLPKPVTAGHGEANPDMLQLSTTPLPIQSADDKDDYGPFNMISDIKTKFFPLVELKDIPDQLPLFLSTSSGSRYIEANLEKARDHDKEILFKKVLHKAVWLSMNALGNYVIQKFFHCGTEDQIAKLMQRLLPETRKISLNKFGSRVIQTAISRVNKEMQAALVKEINKDLLTYCGDHNGQYVVLKSMDSASDLMAPHMLEMIRKIEENTYSMCLDKFGCRIVQKIIETYPHEQCRKVKKEVHILAANMMTSPSGNYVIQGLLLHGTEEDKQVVVEASRGRFVLLAINKYASNTVETLLKKGTTADHAMVMAEISASMDSLKKLMKDQYGNYVLQRLVEVAEVEILRDLHLKMAELIQDQLTPTINAKMHKNFATDFSRITVVELANKVIVSPDSYPQLREKFPDTYSQIEKWFTQIKNHEVVQIEDSDISLIVEVFDTLVNHAHNPDIDCMKQNLRSYLKCLVQDYCKKHLDPALIKNHEAPTGV